VSDEGKIKKDLVWSVGVKADKDVLKSISSQ